MIAAMTNREGTAQNAAIGHHAGLALDSITNMRKKNPRTRTRLIPSATAASHTTMLTVGLEAATCETSWTRRVWDAQADCGRARAGRWICAGAKRAAVRPEAGRTEVWSARGLPKQTCRGGGRGGWADGGRRG